MNYMGFSGLLKRLPKTRYERPLRSWPSNITQIEGVMLISLRRSMLLMRFYPILKRERFMISMVWKDSRDKVECREGSKIFLVISLEEDIDIKEENRRSS
jgi:hypothetical protein